MSAWRWYVLGLQGLGDCIGEVEGDVPTEAIALRESILIRNLGQLLFRPGSIAGSVVTKYLPLPALQLGHASINGDDRLLAIRGDSIIYIGDAGKMIVAAVEQSLRKIDLPPQTITVARSTEVAL